MKNVKLILLVSILCAGAVLGARPVRADTIVIYESGVMSGTVTLTGPTTQTQSGTISFNPGVDGVPGLDYSSANPGSFTGSSTTSGYLTSTGSVSVLFPSSGPALVVATAAGTFTLSAPPAVGTTITFTGPFTLWTVNSPLSFPSNLTSPFVTATSTITALHFTGPTLTSYDFSGTFTNSATLVPEPASLLLMGSGLAALAASMRRGKRRAGLEG